MMEQKHPASRPMSAIGGSPANAATDPLRIIKLTPNRSQILPGRSDGLVTFGHLLGLQ